ASDGHAIPASPIVACLGRLTDVSQCVTLALKEVGSRLYLVGETQRALGGSVLGTILGLRDEGVPEIDIERIVEEHRFLLAAARAGLLRSAHDISDGGLLVTLAEMSFACYPAQRAAIGIELDGCASWSSVGGYESLFGEWGGLVVEVAQRDLERFEELAGTLESVREIGTTIAEPLLAFEEEAWEIADLHRSWSRPLEELYP
ncbi:MAG TPA: AIR synthase-related protein, partial [Candidatus Dormibacteraeota bacterium]|nr:AIR synthase-related protein [Candidatus Dormibacteraeota bacterium]